MFAFKHLLFGSVVVPALTFSVAVMAADAPSLISSPVTDNEYAELYSGVDVAAHGWIFGWMEGTGAPFTNTDTSGVRLRFYGEGGDDQYRSETFPGAINKETWLKDDLLVGYEFDRDNFSAGLYAGITVISALLAQPDPDNRVQGTAVGPQVEGEFEWKANGAMTSGEAYYTTAFNNYEVEWKLGAEVFHNGFVGPEVTLLGDERYFEWRIGAHLTATEINVKNIGDINIALGLGYENNSDIGSGLYGTMTAGLEF